MATSGGDSPKEKKELTPDQKRTFTLLGVMGVLALGAGAIYIPGLIGGSSTPPAPAPVAPNENIPPGSIPIMPPGGPPGAPGAPGMSPDGLAPDQNAAPAPVADASASLLGYTPPLTRSRRDPFQSFVVIAPTPVPPPPAPTPRPAVVIPLPPGVDIPQPGASGELLPPFSPSGTASGGPTGAGTSGIGVPDRGGSASGGASSGGGSFALPPVRIPRLNQVRRAPQSPFPPRRATSAGGGGAPPQTAPDKRLSGVVIAGGVRAALEITRGTETATYVVQPGDTVEGIQVLNVERFTEGGRTQTRMLVRENGQEKYIELRAGAPRALTGGEGAP